MNYRINKLYLKNFKFIKNNEIKKIEFENNDLIILGGPNGYGKTTIFDALEIIFKNKIEGIKKITKHNRILKDSLLLNDGTKSGFLGIELINSYKAISILVEVKPVTRNQELDICVKKYYKNDYLKISDLENFNSEYTSIEGIKEIKGLENFKETNYNLFNYISQKNYCYYLEKDEQERNQIITELLGLSNIIKYENFLDHLVSRKRPNSSLSIKIDLKKEEIKKLINENSLNEFLEKKNKPKTFNFENFSIFNFKNFENAKTIKNLIQLKNYNECQLKNYEFILTNNLKYNNYKTKQIYLYQKQTLDKIKDTLILNSFEENIFLKNYNVNTSYIETERTKYKKLVALKNIDPERINFDKIINFKNYIDIDENKFIKLKEKIDTATKKLKNNEQIILELRNYRENLFNIHKNKETRKVIKEDECPYCGSKLKDLELMYNKISKKIKENNSCEQLDKLYDERDLFVDEIKDKILIIINKLEKNYTPIDKIEKIDHNKLEINNFFKFCKSEKINIPYLKLNELFENKIQEMTDINFETSYDEILNNPSFNDEKIKDIDLNIISEAKEYLKFKFFEIHNLLKIKNQNDVKENIKELIQMEKLYNKLEKIKKIYTNRKMNLEKEVIPKLEIPLYIYTGKVLQDYQRGMGVFIYKTDKGIKFVPEANSEQDLVNSFSSGQLSGFIITLMLVMNKLFKETNNGLNTLLIDDPFHTLDDVNMTSLIEILRRTFYKNQIILSSHEDKKISYILYKYLKFNLKAKEIDVKSKFFDI